MYQCIELYMYSVSRKSGTPKNLVHLHLLFFCKMFTNLTFLDTMQKTQAVFVSKSNQMVNSKTCRDKNQIDIDVSRVVLCDIHLINKHQYRLHGQLAATEVKKIFKRWPKQVHYKHVIFLLYAKPPAHGTTVQLKHKCYNKML